MSNFQEVCLLSCEKWVASFPDDVPKHDFSKQHEEKMKEILQDKRNDTKHKPSRKVITFLILAAIIMAVATTAFAVPASREYIVKKFTDHSEYNVEDTSGFEYVTYLKTNYIPAGFEKTEQHITDGFYIETYNNGDKHFSVNKYIINTTIGYDTEQYESEKIKINGIDAIYYSSDDKLDRIIFNNSEYIFMVSGNIGKDELVKIAQNVE